MSQLLNSTSKRALLFDRFGQNQTTQALVIDPFIGHSVGTDDQNQQPFGKKLLLAIAVVSALHAVVWYVADKLPTQPLQEIEPTPVVIEIIKPEPEKIKEPEIPPVVEQPKIPPVAQKPEPVQKPIQQPKPIEQPKPQPVQKVTPQPVAQPVTESVVTENVRPVPVATPTPTPQPVAENLPVTEAKGYAGYLSNPAPEYPEIALDRGWEGSVILRVKVSPSGSPLEVNVKQSSSKKVLDDAAVRTVKRWKFSPALRGSTPVEGWVDVPIHYQLPK